MTGPLQALADRYCREIEWALSLAHLGLPSARQGCATSAMIPPPRVIAEINSKTREPHVLGVEVTKGDGSVSLTPLRCPLAFWEGREITHDLVRRGVHPLDIKVVTMGLTSGVPAVQRVRTAVDWLFWTSSDQFKLESEIAAEAKV